MNAVPETTTNHKQWALSLQKVQGFEALQSTWLSLQAHSHCSFFTSWGWIKCWLNGLPDTIKPEVLTISLDDEIVGLAIITRRTVTRHKVFTSRAIYMAETGDPQFDALTIEHNGLLARRGLESDVTDKALAFLLSNSNDWDELMISGISHQIDTITTSAQRHGLNQRVIDDKYYYYIDLDALRKNNKEFLSALSSNTRSQVRRAIRGYETNAPLEMQIAATLPEAFAFFDRLKELHQAYWTEKGQPGAFSSTFKTTFHRRLIETLLPEQGIQLIKISAGDKEIGYLYNFVKEGEVSSYQSGFAYEANARLKPGLVSHCLAVEFNIKNGANRYDFLAGDSQYKGSLSTQKDNMLWLALQRNRLKFNVENKLSKLRQWMLSKR